MDDGGVVGRRRTGGVVYTPQELGGFLVDRALDDRPSGNGRWLDPACGDGALLEQVVHRLSERVGAAALGTVVRDRVFGFDVDPRACERARARLARAVERCGGSSTSEALRENIRCVDFLSLDDAPDVQPTYIVANPPYVGATEIDAARKQEYARRFGSAFGRLDLYTLFLEHGLRMLRRGGVMAYLTPDKWLTSASSRRLRALVAVTGDLRSLHRFDRHDLFRGVATIPCVSVIAKVPRSASAIDVRWWDLDGNGRLTATGQHDTIRPDINGTAWLPLTDHGGGTPVLLGDLCERISAGLATGLNDCFVLEPQAARTVEPELQRSIVRGRDIASGTILDSKRTLLVPYTFDAAGGSAKLVDLADFPGARAHLEGHRSALERRHCVRVWGKSWYDLHDPVLVDISQQRKIVLPDVAHAPRFAIDPGQHVPLHSAYYMVLRDDSPVSDVELLELLASARVVAALRQRAPTAKSGYRRFRTQELRSLPLPLARPRTGQSSLLDAA